jgi:serine O-acetyltransferase
MIGSLGELFRVLRRDASRYGELGGWHASLGFWAGAVYRIGCWADGLRLPPVRFVFKFFYWLAKLPCRLWLNIEMSPRIRIGPGLRLMHPYNLMLGPGAELGPDCTLFHDVTIGAGLTPGMPRIGGRVVLFAGCKVLGGISVGAGSEVGANAVLTRSVPEDSLVIAPPARILSQSLMRAPGPAAAPEDGTSRPTP